MRVNLICDGINQRRVNQGAHETDWEQREPKSLRDRWRLREPNLRRNLPWRVNQGGGATFVHCVNQAFGRDPHKSRESGQSRDQVAVRESRGARDRLETA